MYRAAEFPQFWLCDTELFPKGGSGGLGAGLVSADIEDGDYSLVSVSPQNMSASSGAFFFIRLIQELFVNSQILTTN